MAGDFGILAELVLPLVLIPLSLLVGTFGNGMQLLANRQGQRSEYYADDLSAATAGTAAAASLPSSRDDCLPGCQSPAEHWPANR
jgi:Zn-dependent protease with chaperone function